MVLISKHNKGIMKINLKAYSMIGGISYVEAV